MRQMPRSGARAVVLFKVILCVTVVIVFCGEALAMPSPPPSPVKLSSPPPGKVWVDFGGSWLLVSAPPAPGPYVWNGTVWVIDQTPPPPGAEWVPGHWTAEGWVPGHWVAVSPVIPDAVWVPGHWKNIRWVPGHWKNPPRGKKWVAGHYAPDGRWVPGHWENSRSTEPTR